MADSVVSFAAEHIKSLSEADLFHVLSETKAVLKELDNIEKFLDIVRENVELAKKMEFLCWLPKLRRMAYDAEDVVDTYVSEAESLGSLTRGILKFYRSHHASKELRGLRMEMETTMTTMQKQFEQGFTTEDSEKNKEVEQPAVDLNTEKTGATADSVEEKEENSSACTIDTDEEIEGYMYTSSIRTIYSKKVKKAGSRSSSACTGHIHADDDEFVVGIQSDVERLSKMLTVVRKTEDNLHVLAIVGMGGSGKTTLARNIYNHIKVQRHFKYQAWVPLSNQRPLIASDVVSDIFNQISSSKCRIQSHCHDDYDLDTLVQACSRTKKCILVLDDVWDCEFLQDKVLPEIIKSNNDRSKRSWNPFKEDNYDITNIIITSRHQFKPSIHTSLKWSFHEMKLLSKEDGWALFNMVSRSNNGKKDLAQEYSGLAMEMLKKCGGLPLAIVALGKLLKTKNTIREWERVFSELVTKEGPKDLYLPVNEILALSYRDLRYDLKPCFLYFGLFPEDFTIRAQTLMRMWIAEGFVKQPSEGASEKSLDDAARQLLQKLIEHTMVQVVDKTYTGKVKILRVHNIMRDLCIKEAQELDFLTVCSSEPDQITNNSRRAAVNISKCSSLPLENSCLRTLFLHEHERVGKHPDKGKQQAVLNLTIVCEKFILLRVLDIYGIKTADGVMPKEIGNLIHLRYLRIRSTNIRELPKSIGKLRKLLTLDYWDVLSVDNSGIRLPDVLWKLRQLRHLYLPNEMTNKKESFKLHTITDLQTLWGVRGGNWMLKEMPNLSTKINKLSIQGISTSEQMKSLLIKCPLITTHDNLYSLSLDWYGFSLEGLEALCSKNSLKKLRLMGKVSSKPFKFPSNLEKLELYYTQFDQQGRIMEAIEELQCLKFLRLAKDSFVGKEWNISTEQPFPLLEELKLSDLSKLEIWKVPTGTMPHLKKLSIVSCTSLNQIPQGLKSVPLKIEQMPDDFRSKLQFQNPTTNKAKAEANNIILHIRKFAISRNSSYALISISVLCIILCEFFALKLNSVGIDLHP